MSDDILELFTDKGEPTGKPVKRSEAHRTGAWHTSIHLWLFIPDGIVLQKRSLYKESFPGLYDVSAAGHISFGETPIRAAVRETKEELGIEIPPSGLIPVEKRVLQIKHEKTGFISNEFNYVFLAEAPLALDDLVSCPEEIDSLKCVQPQWLLKDIQSHPELYCININELQAVLRTLENK